MNKYFDIEVKVNDQFDENVMKRLAVEIKPEWSISQDDIVTTCVRGGITNSLFACYLKSNGLNHNETILFRVYGENSEKFISRSNEIDTMCLMNKEELGPKFYGRFKNGICYEYLAGSILDQRMVFDENIFPKVAKAIAGLHMVQFIGLVRESDLNNSEQIFIFTEIMKLFDLVDSDYKANMSNMTDSLFKLIPSKQSLRDEIRFLQDHLIEYTTKHRSLITFSHNDLLMGNIIYNPGNSKEIKFIDYEYSCINYQAYDIANHFNEFAGVDAPDYSFFPNKDYQMNWLSIYLNEFYQLVNRFYQNEPSIHLVLSQEKLEQFYEEVNKFTLASHLMWAIWSLVQAQVSKLEFDFVAYAHIRFDQYYKKKKELIQI